METLERHMSTQLVKVVATLRRATQRSMTERVEPVAIGIKRPLWRGPQLRVEEWRRQRCS